MNLNTANCGFFAIVKNNICLTNGDVAPTYNISPFYKTILYCKNPETRTRKMIFCFWFDMEEVINYFVLGFTKFEVRTVRPLVKEVSFFFKTPFARKLFVKIITWKVFFWKKKSCPKTLFFMFCLLFCWSLESMTCENWNHFFVILGFLDYMSNK